MKTEKKKSIVANTTFKLPLFLLLDQVVTVHKKQSCTHISIEAKFFYINIKPLPLLLTAKYKTTPYT